MSSTARSSTIPSSPLPPTSASASAVSTPRRPPPLPAVKGTMGAIDTPRNWSPLRSRQGTPAPSVAPTLDDSEDTAAATAVPDRVSEVAFRADARMATCFEGLPEGADEVRRLFGV